MVEYKLAEALFIHYYTLHLITKSSSLLQYSISIHRFHRNFLCLILFHEYSKSQRTDETFENICRIIRTQQSRHMIMWILQISK
jgi:hypothetical protein